MTTLVATLGVLAVAIPGCARGGMPSALLHGNDAEQVARYVATYAGK